jgi:hypothetical protein
MSMPSNKVAMLPPGESSELKTTLNYIHIAPVLVVYGANSCWGTEQMALKSDFVN